MTTKPTPDPAPTPHPEKLIKSKDRVRDLAEVFTAKREVNAMCDLIPPIATPTARVMEPSCGNGNFLAEILDRRLKNLDSKVFRRRPPSATSATATASSSKPRKLPPTKQVPLEIGILQVFAHIYGVDISKDNTEECKSRLLTHAQEFYQQNNRHTWLPNPLLWKAVKLILDHNIIHGNTLLQTPSCPQEHRITLINWIFLGTNSPLDTPASRVCLQYFNFADLTKQPATPFHETPFTPWSILLNPQSDNQPQTPTKGTP